MVNHIDNSNYVNIKKRIKELEKEVANLRPNGSCKQIRRDADILLAKIERLRQQQEM